MAKRKGQPKDLPTHQPKTSLPDETSQPRRFGWIPTWGLFLLFLVPLLMSEYMFYMAGRTFSLFAFPLAWAGFWLIMMRRRQQR